MPLSTPTRRTCITTTRVIWYDSKVRLQQKPLCTVPRPPHLLSSQPRCLNQILTHVCPAAGSWMCLPCDRHRVPSDDAVFTWDADCTWKCKAGYYQDIRQGECVSCDATCTGVGMYRPQCTGTETRLPTCIACSIDSINADMWNATLGVNYEYTEQGGCAYACLPGFSNSSNRCAPCTQQNPPNSSFVGTNCEFRCNRGECSSHEGTSFSLKLRAY